MKKLSFEYIVSTPVKQSYAVVDFEGKLLKVCETKKFAKELAKEKSARVCLLRDLNAVRKYGMGDYAL